MSLSLSLLHRYKRTQVGPSVVYTCYSHRAVKCHYRSVFNSDSYSSADWTAAWKVYMGKGRQCVHLRGGECEDQAGNQGNPPYF